MKIGKESFLERVEPEFDGMVVIEGYENIKKNYLDYLKDESNTGYGYTEKLFFPTTINNIVWIFNEAIKNNKTVTVSGGKTGICGGAVPYEGWLISMDKMKRILDLKCSGDDYLLYLESGVRLDEIARVLKEKDFPFTHSCVEKMKKSKNRYFYPPDPTETTATIGGTIATNASGARTLRFGPTRDFVESLDIVLPNGYYLKIKRGDIVSDNGIFNLNIDGKDLTIKAPDYKVPETKHSAGIYSARPMDLIDFFIGSEGVLGIITAAAIKIVRAPDYVVSGMTFFDSEDSAANFVELSRGSIPGVTSLEYFDIKAVELINRVKKDQGPVSEIPDIPSGTFCIYFESFHWKYEGVKDSLLKWKDIIKRENGKVADTLASIEDKDAERLKRVRHSVPEEINRMIAEIKQKQPEIHKVGTDMAVPDGKLKEMLEYYRKILDKEGINYVVFGHIGNNHLHVNMIPENNEELKKALEIYTLFAKKAVSLGGTVSGEHGIGKIKKRYLRIMFGESDISQMKNVKMVFDPQNILNPGVIFS